MTMMMTVNNLRCKGRTSHRVRGLLTICEPQGQAPLTNTDTHAKKQPSMTSKAPKDWEAIPCKRKCCIDLSSLSRPTILCSSRSPYTAGLPDRSYITAPFPLHLFYPPSSFSKEFLSNESLVRHRSLLPRAYDAARFTAISLGGTENSSIIGEFNSSRRASTSGNNIFCGGHCIEKKGCVVHRGETTEFSNMLAGKWCVASLLFARKEGRKESLLLMGRV